MPKRGAASDAFPPLEGVRAWFAEGELKGPVDVSKVVNALGQEPKRGAKRDVLLPLDGGGAERSEAEGVISPHPALRATLPVEGEGGRRVSCRPWWMFWPETRTISTLGLFLFPTPSTALILLLASLMGTPVMTVIAWREDGVS
jgi:hypothetical protein